MNNIYISYSQEDKLWKDLIVDQFNKAGLEKNLSIWEESHPTPGVGLTEPREKALNESCIIILLISIDYLHADFVKKKLIPYLKKQSATASWRIIGILLRPCAWTAIDWLNRLQMYPKDITALSTKTRFDAELEIENFVAKMKAIFSSYEENINKANTPLVSSVPVLYDPYNPVFNVPYRAKREGMVGRQEAMAKLREQLLTGKPTAIGHTAAFQGLGGLGKTQLAVEYAYQYKDEYPRGVIWLNADQDMDAQLIQIAGLACWISPDSRHEDILAVARHRLRTSSQCLIIFDNVENRAAIEHYLPLATAEPHVLVTSRTLQKDFTPIPLDLLDNTQALQLLLKESDRDYDGLTEDEKTAAGEIAAVMDGLPLAIEIAGAYLRYNPDCTFRGYQSMLTDNFSTVMAGDLLSSLTQHEKNLFHTLQVSRPVFEQAPLLQEILDLLAWSGSVFMGLSLMATILGKKEAELLHPLTVGKSLRILHKAGEGERYDIHRLVRKVRREQFPLAERDPWVKDVCLRLGNWFEERREEFNNLRIFEGEIDHLQEWLQHVAPISQEHAARLTWLLAYPQYHWGKYRETHQLVQAAYQLLEKLADADPKLKANVMADLGYTCGALGNHPESLKYHEQALEIRRQILGERHPDTATSLDNVGITYGALGNHKEALKYKGQALEICRQLLGERHPDTAKSLNNVGYTYGAMGNHKEALKYQEQALDIYRQLLGERHPYTATSLNNVGGAYGAMGNHKEQLKYQEQALEIYRQLLGERHPDTASSLNNVGLNYLDLGKFIEAHNFCKQALEIRCQLLGEHHPYTATSVGNVALCLIKLKQFKEANR